MYGIVKKHDRILILSTRNYALQNAQNIAYLLLFNLLLLLSLSFKRGFKFVSGKILKLNSPPPALLSY